MIIKRTVLILGAGSSTHIGYPLGKALVNAICARLENKQIPDEAKKAFSSGQIDAFYDRLRNSHYPSIDTFLERNPKMSEMGTLFIADCLKQYEDQKSFAAPKDPGWYVHLLDALATPGTDTLESLTTAPLTIITFNYDRSLEAFLHRAVKHRYDVSDDDAWCALSSIPFIHPHGILGEYPAVPYTASLDRVSLSTIANKIKIIYQLAGNDDDFRNDAFKEANLALIQAERIVFLGFGFHDDNIRRFRFFSHEALEGKEVVGTLFAPSMVRGRIIETLKKYGIDGGPFSLGDVNWFFGNQFALI
jgi:hypothetical protein